jgi:hypothetical protein
MSDSKRKYATAVHPSIEAVLAGLYRYKTREQAQERIKALGENFVLSKEQPNEKDVILMWIKGFAVTEEEEKEGFTGHFARIAIQETDEGKFTVTAARHDIPLEVHPQKKRVIMRHPNWGHPVLRSSKRGRVYETMEDAQNELLLLHEEFPEVSIPGVGKMYIIVYGRKEGSKKPIHKIAIEIQPDKEGKGFILVTRDNEKDGKKKERKIHARMNMDKPADAPKGYFSSLEVIRKEKKKKKLGQRFKVVKEDPQDADKKEE